MNMERTYTGSLKPGKKVLVQGWVAKTRDLGGLQFFILRDRQGSVQVTAKKGRVSDGIFKKVSGLGREWCVSVEGEAVKSAQAPGGIEVIPSRIDVVSEAASPLPLDFEGKIQSGKDKRFDYRFMDLRNTRVQAIFRVMDAVLTRMREFFGLEGFVETTTPTIQAAGAEGGATMFPIIYYKREAFLRQSPQLYKQILMASGLDRVYEIGPAFRAEKFHTVRHVSEFLSVDAEMSWIESEEDVLRFLEGMMAYVLKGVKKDCRAELRDLGAKVDVPKLPFKRVTYDEAIKMLGKKGTKIKWGEDLGDVQERMLGEILSKKGHDWYFIKGFPSRIKPFYIMMDGRVSRGFDMDYKGLEIASGGQREHRLDVLKKVMKSKGLDPHKFKFYLDAFTWGMPSHGGFGLGAERLVQKIVGADNIREAIMFPRTPERLLP